jgi:hypothetical protein
MVIMTMVLKMMMIVIMMLLARSVEHTMNRSELLMKPSPSQS